MSLLAFEIPEKPAQIANWLERHVVDVRLSALVAELAAVNGRDEGVKMSMERSLDTLMSEVLTSGLSVLGHDRLRWFLQYPEWLFELQERVFVDGGPYWDHVADETRMASADALQAGWELLKLHTTTAARPTRPTPPEPIPRPVPPTVTKEVSNFDWYAILPYVLTVAATILVVLGLEWTVFRANPVVEPKLAGDPIDPPPAAPAAWGWNRSDALDAQTDREYLVTLANSADEWFKKRPETPADVAQRIHSFRAGCSRLLLAEHRLLAPDDRTWLEERCRAWADQLDDQLARLEAGEDARSVRNSTDQTITKLVIALRNRAESV